MSPFRCPLGAAGCRGAFVGCGNFLDRFDLGSLICRNSINFVTKPITARTGAVGTAAVKCYRQWTQVPLDALRSTCLLVATGAGTLRRISLPLAGYVIIGGIGGRIRKSRTIIDGLSDNGFQAVDGCRRQRTRRADRDQPNDIFVILYSVHRCTAQRRSGR